MGSLLLLLLEKTIFFFSEYHQSEGVRQEEKFWEIICDLKIKSIKC